MKEELLAQIDESAKSLFIIAAQNDKGHLLYQNQTFTICMEALARLHQLCSEENIAGITGWLNLSAYGSNISFLQLTAAFLKVVESPRIQGVRTEISDYDHFVLMAAAESLSEIMWHDKTQPQVPGPSLSVCIDEFGFQDMIVVYQIFIKNYVGSILQLLFEAAKVRMTNPSVDPETEFALKENEAAAFTNYVFAVLQKKNLVLNAKNIIEQLKIAHQIISPAA